MTSKIQVNFRFNEVLRGTDDYVSWIFNNFFTVHVFQVKESISDFPTKLSCVDDLENQGQLAVQEVQDFQNFFTVHVLILSYGISLFLHCLCFRGQGIHF